MKNNYFQVAFLIKATLFYTILFTCFTSLVNAQTAMPGSGKALNFNGLNNYLDAGLNNRNVTNKITAEAWINTGSFDYRWIIGKYSNTQGEDAGFHLIINGGKASFNGRNKSDQYFTSGSSSTIIADNNWHHLAGVYNNGRWEIWVDGILENSLTTFNTLNSLATINARLTIGNYHEFNENYFDGNIDEVRVWNTARTEDQIRENMCLKLTGTEPNLVGYFKFDEQPTNNSFRDYSNSKINAQLVNINAGTIQELSGAPLGNAAKSFYKHEWHGKWTSDLAELAGGNYQTFRLTSVSANVKGVHLYRVDSSPNNSNGITGGTNINYYYGAFSVVSSVQPVTYTVNQKIFSGNDCYALYQRDNNASINWNLLPIENPIVANTLTKVNEAYRGEYIVNTSSKPALRISESPEICFGITTELNAEVAEPGTFLWSTGATTKKITVNKPGVYGVKFTTSSGCFSEASITVIENSAALSAFNLGRDTSLCETDKIILTAPSNSEYSYTWQDGSQGATFTVAREGLFWLEIANALGCTRRDSISITYNGNCKPVIPNIITPNGDNLNETFVIKNIVIQQWQLEIFNRWGNIIYQTESYNNDWDAKNLTSGVYYYKLSNPIINKSYKGYLEVVR